MEIFLKESDSSFTMDSLRSARDDPGEVYINYSELKN